MHRTALSFGLALVAGAVSLAATCGPPPTNSFVNWETPTVHPLDLTPDGTRLLAANLPDNRVEVFDVSGSGAPVKLTSIPVGLDPVTVRAHEPVALSSEK